MTTTDLDVLVQACRNARGKVNLLGQELDSWTVDAVRLEYNRLIRLKKSKKRWKA